jgi:hypothetical protein
MDMLLQDDRICGSICLSINIYIFDLHICVFDSFYFQSGFQPHTDLKNV